MRASFSGLPNRVAPDGALFATPHRGQLMGNRGGRFHDATSQKLGARRWATKQWICCVTSFKGRKEPVWGPNRYTQLFFCDEITALAAGHRPCMECRRADAMAYRRAAAGCKAPLICCPQLDRQLDSERRIGPTKLSHERLAQTLPDGAMIKDHNTVFLALKGELALPWSPAGYAAPTRRPVGMVSVLTPPTSLLALQSGL